MQHDVGVQVLANEQRQSGLVGPGRDISIVNIGEACHIIPVISASKVQKGFELVLVRDSHPIQALSVDRGHRAIS